MTLDMTVQFVRLQREGGVYRFTLFSADCVA